MTVYTFVLAFSGRLLELYVTVYTLYQLFYGSLFE